MNPTIPSQPREAFGKNASYRIRQTGRIPAILYGEGRPNVGPCPGQEGRHPDSQVRNRAEHPVQDPVEGGDRDVMIKDVQIDPLTDQLIHADLIQIDMNKAVRVEVPIELLGEADRGQDGGRVHRFHDPRTDDRMPPGDDSRALDRGRFGPPSPPVDQGRPTSPCPKGSS